MRKGQGGTGRHLVVGASREGTGHGIFEESQSQVRSREGAGQLSYPVGSQMLPVAT